MRLIITYILHAIEKYKVDYHIACTVQEELENYAALLKMKNCCQYKY